MLAALPLAAERREQLPSGCKLLIGDDGVMSHEVLQDTFGALMHGAQDWLTLRVRKPSAPYSAWPCAANPSQARQRSRPYLGSALASPCPGTWPWHA